jgi:hypothetical protein
MEEHSFVGCFGDLPVTKSGGAQLHATHHSIECIKILQHQSFITTHMENII